MSLSVGRVNWQIAKELLRSVREKVFVCEWRIPKKVEFDQHDKHAVHVLVCDDRTQEPIATGRILASGEISRIAVLRNHRGKEADKLVLECLLKTAREQGNTEVFVNVSLDAVDYFRSHHFEPIGAVYMEAGLPRQTMSIQLSETSSDINKMYLSH